MRDMTESAQPRPRDEPLPGRYDEEQIEREEGDSAEEEMPRVQITRERMLLFALFVISAIAFLYFVLPRLAGLGKTWDRIQEGDPWWLAGALLLECLAFAGCLLLFRTVFTRGEARSAWRERCQS